MRLVLLVDDDEFFLKLEGDVLRALGYEVVPVLSALEALDVDWPKIAAVVCDLEMPEMNGIELLRAVRESGATQAPFLFLTSRDPQDELIGAAIKYSADYLPKSPDTTAIAAWLASNVPNTT